MKLFPKDRWPDHDYALFSDDARHRYVLTRNLGDVGQCCLFIGLNPSTATAEKDDPTVRRMQGFARSWGFGGLIVCNLFAYRSTDPMGLRRTKDPVGEHNDSILAQAHEFCHLTVASWGIHGAYDGRGAVVAETLPGMWCLGVTKAGHPRHPLYLRSDTPLQRFTHGDPNGD